MATAFNFIGAFAGTAVAKTIGAGLVNDASTTQAIVAAALIGAIFWNLLTWWLGLPSSSSHALIGGLLGATIVGAGFDQLNLPGIWDKVIVPLVTSPIIGFAIALVLMVGLYWLFRKATRRPLTRGFRRVQVLSAGYMAFAHGSNDAQKTMGIITLALVASGVLPERRHDPVGGHRDLGDRDQPRHRGRRLADHAHDGPPRGGARADPRVRRRDHRRDRDLRRRPARACRSRPPT